MAKYHSEKEQEKTSKALSKDAKLTIQNKGIHLEDNRPRTLAQRMHIQAAEKSAKSQNTLQKKSTMGGSQVLQARWVYSKWDNTRYREIDDDIENPPRGFREYQAGDPIPNAPVQPVPLTMDQKRQALIGIWGGKAVANQKPTEMDLVNNQPPVGEIPLDKSKAVIGTDRQNDDKLLPEVKRQKALPDQNHAPNYMAGFLHNKGEDYSDENQLEFLGEISNSADRIDVAHEKIQNRLNAAAVDPQIAIESLHKERHKNFMGTPEEVDHLINGKKDDNQDGAGEAFIRSTAPTHRWVKGTGKYGEHDHVPGYLAKLDR